MTKKKELGGECESKKAKTIICTQCLDRPANLLDLSGFQTRVRECERGCTTLLVRLASESAFEVYCERQLRTVARRFEKNVCNLIAEHSFMLAVLQLKHHTIWWSRKKGGANDKMQFASFSTDESQ
jgi:hypothetical protein